MMKRIPWNIYEATLMLDTYFRIESGEIASKSAIAELSSALRLMAVNNGDIIALLVQLLGQVLPHFAATHDNDIHGSLGFQPRQFHKHLPFFRLWAKNFIITL